MPGILHVAMGQKQSCYLFGTFINCLNDIITAIIFYADSCKTLESKELNIELLKLDIWGIKIWEVLGPMSSHKDPLPGSVGGN